MGSALLPGELPSPLRAVRHHVALVIGTLLVFLGGAGLYYFQIHEAAYTAQATVLVSPVPGSPLSPETASGSGTQLAVAMETEAGLVDTPQVQQLVAENVGEELPGPGEELSVVVPTGTQMIQISFTSGTPEGAQLGAQAYADAYLEFRGQMAESTKQDRLDVLNAQLDRWTEQLQAATTEAADGDALAAQQVQIASARVADLNASISSAEVVSTAPGTVTSPATEPTSADGFSPVLVLGAAGLMGIVLGVLLALVAEWRRDLVRDDEAFEISGLPVFATLPAGTPATIIGSKTIVGVEDPAAREAYRRLRAGIVANSPAPRAIAVSAVGLRHDASAVAANLAITLGQAGFKVILVAANPEADELSELMGTIGGPGLAEVLADTRKYEDVVTEVDGISVLRDGDARGQRDLYGGPELRQLIDNLKQTCDYVVVNAASTGTADGDAAISAADDVLLAVISSRTTHTQVTAALDRFSQLAIHPVGIVNTPGSSNTQRTASVRHASSGSRWQATGAGRTAAATQQDQQTDAPAAPVERTDTSAQEPAPPEKQTEDHQIQDQRTEDEQTEDQQTEQSERRTVHGVHALPVEREEQLELRVDPADLTGDDAPEHDEHSAAATSENDVHDPAAHR